MAHWDPRAEQDQYYDAVLRDKYAKGDERTAEEVLHRVAQGLAEAERKEERAQWAERFFDAMQAGFCPAGRIMSAAGSGLEATLINCFVQPIGDAIAGNEGGKPGIYTALLEAAETMRRGGGVGYDFSAIRPRGARVQGTQSRASGPISYMRVFDRSCETVESAGARRGAQMAVLRVDHPDIEEFIRAKDIRPVTEPLRGAGLGGAELEEILQALRPLSNFNLSVAVTDEFMRRKAADGLVELVHAAEPDPQLFPGARRRNDGLWVYREIPARQLWDAILATTYETADPGVVFIDRVNAENNLAYCERLTATNPCGEQPLPDYGCCCLGSINLVRFVRDPFSNEASLDWEGLAKTAELAVRMLDNVLDVSYWPLPAQAREAQAKRRIGLGFTGLGSALILLRLGYGSEEGRAMAARVARTLRDAAYGASVGLAQERGAFPAFQAEGYLRSPFIQRLPQALRERIGRHGIRNSHLLSIAPTGTISLAFGRNVTGGIEPAFAWEYTRRSRLAEGGTRRYPVQEYAYRLWLARGGDPGNLPPFFVSAQTLAPEDHLRMQAAVQPFIDSAISKTVNVPRETSFQGFRDLYDRAYEWGCKGCTTYRPNDVTGAILSAEPAPQPTLALAEAGDPRLQLRQLPTAPLASLKWPGRPEFPNGNPAWTYLVDGGTGCRFAVMVGHVEDGERYPFEVWVNGAEQPRGLGAVAKLLSMDMRSRDRAWLRRKLEALIRTTGNPIRTPMPPAGEPTVMASPCAALARIVLHRCRELGSLDADGPTPIVDALITRDEPRTDASGAMSWSVDLRNPATGDDCVLLLRELLLPDGQRWPYAVALSGNYPRDLDGLCRTLSLDMRVLDPAWIAVKLRKLASFPETGGAFLAPVPGHSRQRSYPSTIAYMAALLHYRYAMLGLLDEEGEPRRGQGLVDAEAPAAAPELGRACPDCGAHAVVRREGCEACASCGWMGPCG